MMHIGIYDKVYLQFLNRCSFILGAKGPNHQSLHSTSHQALFMREPTQKAAGNKIYESVVNYTALKAHRPKSKGPRKPNLTALVHHRKLSLEGR